MTEMGGHYHRNIQVARPALLSAEREDYEPSSINPFMFNDLLQSFCLWGMAKSIIKLSASDHICRHKTQGSKTQQLLKNAILLIVKCLRLVQGASYL